MNGRAVTMIDDALFGSVRTAVRFGICFTGIPRSSSLWTEMVGGIRERLSDAASSRVDVAGQAGIVMAVLRKDMTPYHLAVLSARLLPSKTDCHCGQPCCSGTRPNMEWEGAITMVALGAQSALGTGFRQDLARALVSRVYERSGSIRRLARRYDVNERVVESAAERFRTYVEKESEAEAWMQAGDALRRIGVVRAD